MIPARLSGAHLHGLSEAARWPLLFVADQVMWKTGESAAARWRLLRLSDWAREKKTMAVVDVLQDQELG